MRTGWGLKSPLQSQHAVMIQSVDYFTRGLEQQSRGSSDCCCCCCGCPLTVGSWGTVSGAVRVNHSLLTRGGGSLGGLGSLMVCRSLMGGQGLVCGLEGRHEDEDVDVKCLFKIM